MSAVNYKELNLNKIWLRPLQILLLSVALYTTIIIYHSNRNHLGQSPPPPSTLLLHCNKASFLS